MTKKVCNQISTLLGKDYQFRESTAVAGALEICNFYRRPNAIPRGPIENTRPELSSEMFKQLAIIWGCDDFRIEYVEVQDEIGDGYNFDFRLIAMRLIPIRD